MKQRSLFVTLFAISVLIVFGSPRVHYVIKGEVEGMEGKTMYVYDYAKDVKIDSAKVVNGKILIEGDYDRDAFVRVEGGRAFSNCVLDGEVIVDFNTYFPSSGSTANMLCLQAEKYKEAVFAELDKVYDDLVSQGVDKSEAQEKRKDFAESKLPEIKKYYYDAILSNPNGAGECLMMTYLSNFRITPEEWESLYSQLSERLRNLPTTVWYNTKFANEKATRIGNRFVDFHAKTLDGKEAKLSDYVGKGKYVLIDFWASWCGPCLQEAKDTLVPLYEKYKDNPDFDILGVAVWDAHDATVKALDRLDYRWPQIIDAGKVPMELYGFNAIPMIMLLGPDGTIIERGNDFRGDKIIKAVESAISE